MEERSVSRKILLLVYIMKCLNFFIFDRSDRRGKKGWNLLHQARCTPKLSSAAPVTRKLAGGLGQMLFSRYIGVLIFIHLECHSFAHITTDYSWNYYHLQVLLIHLTKLGNPLSKVSIRGKSRCSLIHSWIFLMAGSWSWVHWTLTKATAITVPWWPQFQLLLSM